MFDRIAILVSVEQSQFDDYFPDYSTQGVGNAKVAFANSVLSYVQPGLEIWDLGNSPTKGNVVEALQDAAAELSGYGSLLFYFTGHGANVEGGEDVYEDSDQAMVCYDGFLYDDELTSLLSRFKPSTKVLSLIDACHSGTMVDWNRPFPVDTFPKVFHYAACSDFSLAPADTNGGLLTQAINNLLPMGAFQDQSYLQLGNLLKQQLFQQTFEFNYSNNVTPYMLNKLILT